MVLAGEGTATGRNIMLRYGVLGLLIERRGYGYQLVQRLAERLGPAWQLNHSAVYGALDQLESAKLIQVAPGAPVEADAAQASSERSSRRAARVVYQATDRGIAEFQAWLARPSLRATPIRSEIQLKVALAGPDNIPGLLASIAQEEWTIIQRLDQQCQAAGAARHSHDPNLPAPGGQSASSGRAASGGEGSCGSSQPADPSVPGEANGWISTATALVNAAAATRLQGELAWIEIVRETLQRMTSQQIRAAGHPALAGAATR